MGRVEEEGVGEKVYEKGMGVVGVCGVMKDERGIEEWMLRKVGEVEEGVVWVKIEGGRKEN